MVIDSDVLLKLTLETAPPPVTVTTQVAVLLPSCVVTVIVAVPHFWAVITPYASTLATDASLELQIRFVFVEFEGIIVAVNCFNTPTLIVVVAGLNETEVGTTLLEFPILLFSVKIDVVV